MLINALTADPATLTTFKLAQVMDGGDMDGRSRVSDRLPGESRLYRYRLRDRALWRTPFATPIFRMAIRSAGSILVSLAADRFATEIAVGPEPRKLVAFTSMSSGSLTLVRDETAATAISGQALVYRPEPGTRLVSSDDNARSSVFFQAASLETALEEMLDDNLREPLAFQPVLDCSHGLAASLRRQLEFVTNEFAVPGGVADNPVALASLTDLLAALVLRGAAHNYTDRLDRGVADAAPAYVRRAEEFMRAHAAEPLRMSQVAAAAGCSVRTLGAVFRSFRGKTPLGVLQAIRIEETHRALSLAARGQTVGAIARRHGFTNATRFTAAFRRRYGEAPSEILHRAWRRQT